MRIRAGELWLFIVYCTVHHTSHITLNSRTTGMRWGAGTTQLSSPVSEAKFDPADIPGTPNIKYRVLSYSRQPCHLL